MKLSKAFLTHVTNGETILVPSGKAEFSGIVRGNKTLGAVLDLLKEETSEEQIIESMKKRFDAPEEVIERDVARALAELRSIGAIDE